VKFEAEIDEDEEFEAKLYGAVVGETIQVRCAKLEIGSKKWRIPSANITVTQSAFPPIVEVDDDHDDDHDDEDDDDEDDHHDD
jgi:hypothetical protein